MNEREQCNTDVRLRSQIQAGIDHQKSLEANDTIATKDAELAAAERERDELRVCMTALDGLAGDYARAVAELAARDQRIAELESALKSVEWLPFEDKFYFCPSCGSDDGKHAERCKLATALYPEETP